MARLYKRGKTWYCDLFISGRRTRKPLSTDKRIAEGKLGELVGKRNSIKHAHAPKSVPIQEFVDTYINQLKIERNKKTWQTYIRAFKNVLRLHPLRKLDQLTPQILDNCRTEWVKEGRTGHSINQEIGAIVKTLRTAEQWGYIPIQNWKTVRYIKMPKGRLRYFSDEEIAAISSRCKNKYRTALHLGLLAGLRLGEICHLEFTDIDFDRNRIHISPKSGWTPKSYERRWVPMPQDLTDYLRRLRNKSKSKYVLGLDQPMNVDSLGSRFSDIVSDASVPDGSIHTLRHTYASRYVQSGGDIYRLMRYMGHANIKTTQIYAHLSDDESDATIGKMKMCHVL